MSDCTSRLLTNSSVSWDRPTALATSEDAMANCMLNFASNAVFGRSLRSINICISPVETQM